MRQTYEIYLVFGGCGCDSEWRYLGKLEADTTDDALAQAAHRWKEYEYQQESLVALSLDSIASAPPLPLPLPLPLPGVKSSASL